MQKVKTVHYLGNEHCPGSTNWNHLHTPVGSPWYVTKEKDYDIPDKEGYTDDILQWQINNHSLGGIPLAEIVAKKLAEIGKTSN
jgi:hypothetical protein